jgi:putative nucleotidyltransferase with HDIG domain
MNEAQFKIPQYETTYPDIQYEAIKKEVINDLQKNFPEYINDENIINFHIEIWIKDKKLEEHAKKSNIERPFKIREHCFNTAKYCKIIANYCDINRQMISTELDKDDKNNLIIAGLLHDLGKINTPNEILNSTAPQLTEEERKIIERHSRDGLDMLNGYNENVAQIVIHHHEYDNVRHDETSYDDSAKYNHRRQIDKIPELEALEASNKNLGHLLRIANEFDAISTDRPYGNRFSINKIRKHFKENFIGVPAELIEQLIKSLPKDYEKNIKNNN